MTRLLLALDKARAEGAEGFDEVFVWDDGAHSTFAGTIGPGLEALGKVPPLSRDFVRIALAVFAADRSVSRQRGGSNWNARELDLTIGVSAPRKWQGQADALSQLLAFLTGDVWTLRFFKQEVPQAERLPLKQPAPDRVVLLSGGADSACGAVLSRSRLPEGSSHVLVSHFSLTTLSPVQQTLSRMLNELLPARGQTHHQVYLNRGSTRLDGSHFANEASSRSRSMLFLALGLAAAAPSRSPLWIPENGFASLNPPLGPERRGSLSTRTTHPWYLATLQQLLADVGAHGVIENPFVHMTKGEMFRQIAEIVGDDAAAGYLSATNSCAHTDARYSGAPAASSCGVCFGCIVRRAAFRASGLEDRTAYLNDAGGKFADFVSGKSIEVAVEDFVRRGVGGRDIMAMSLPDGYPAATALDLAQRGVEELRGYIG